jgi:tripartite-type tricarboxylate transporter receptor subunit TctC
MTVITLDTREIQPVKSIARRRLAPLLAAPALLPAAALGQGAAFPDRPIRLLVPFPPGGSNDIVARVMQPRLQEALGRTVLVENRGGGSGAVAHGETARAAPDGGTWALVNDTLAGNDTLQQNPFRVAENFSFSTVIGTCPYVLVTQRDSPLRAWSDVVAAARARPATLNYATTGSGSGAHIATVLLTHRADIRLVHVPYRGGGPALQDVLAGHVPLFMSNIVILMPHLRAGRLRAIGATSPEPSRFLPGVPTFRQLGFSEFEALTYWSVVGPAGIAPPLLARMQQAVASAMRDAGVRTRMDEMGAEVLVSTPAEAEAFIRGEAIRWGRVIRENDIRGDS